MSSSDSDYRRLNILVIDDSDVARAMMERTLKQNGYRVIGMPSPIGATRTIMRENIDVVVIDLQMPDVPGDRVATLFRNGPRLDRMGVVLVSGSARAELEKIGKACGADAVVTKEEAPQMLPFAVRHAFLARRK
jgi:CheY-like chemotaxis protein